MRMMGVYKGIMRTVFLIMVCVFALSACGGNSGGVGEVFGLDKRVPDEFSVVARAPLTLPPDFTLRPTAPESREEQTAEENIQRAIFGGTQEHADVAVIESQRRAGVSEGEIYILRSSESLQDYPDVRRLVDLETARLTEEDVHFVRDLLGLTGEYGEELKPKEEYERLQQDTSE